MASPALEYIICKYCENSQDSSQFYRNDKGYWTRECKTCKAARGRKFRIDNRDRYRKDARERARQWRIHNPEKAKAGDCAKYWKDPEKHREVRKKRYWANPQVAREAVKKAYRANPDLHKQKAAQWRLRNLERANDNQRKWRLGNPDRIRILKHRDYEKRKEHVRAKNDAWAKANPQNWTLIQRAMKGRRRAQIRKTNFEKFSLKEILLRDGYKCHICLRKVAKKDLSFDHLVPLSRGGSHTRDNVAVAHLRCNIKRGAGRVPAQLLLIG